MSLNNGNCYSVWCVVCGTSLVHLEFDSYRCMVKISFNLNSYPVTTSQPHQCVSVVWCSVSGIECLLGSVVDCISYTHVTICATPLLLHIDRSSRVPTPGVAYAERGDRDGPIQSFTDSFKVWCGVYVVCMWCAQYCVHSSWIVPLTRCACVPAA
jgi:hypothetical protein